MSNDKEIWIPSKKEQQWLNALNALSKLVMETRHPDMDWDSMQYSDKEVFRIRVTFVLDQMHDRDALTEQLICAHLLGYPWPEAIEEQRIICINAMFAMKEIIESEARQ
jgi:hypothetical protein